MIKKIPPGQYAQRPPPPPPLIVEQTGSRRAMWDESCPRPLREGEPPKAGVTPLAAEGPDPSAALTFDLGKTKSMIFPQYQLKVQTRHSFPGYNALKFRFLTNIHKLRDINPKKGTRHQYKRPGGEDQRRGESFTGNPRVGSTTSGGQDQHILRRAEQKQTHTNHKMKVVPQERPTFTAPPARPAYALNR